MLFLLSFYFVLLSFCYFFIQFAHAHVALFACFNVQFSSIFYIVYCCNAQRKRISVIIQQEKSSGETDSLRKTTTEQVNNRMTSTGLSLSTL